MLHLIWPLFDVLQEALVYSSLSRLKKFEAVAYL
jgi:hypothetical protein